MGPSGDDRVGGRYELVRRLARGGAGTVWQGVDHLLDREVAIKHVEIAGDAFHDPGGEAARDRARVRSEARAAARLRHPGAVAIYDVVDQDDDIFLVLEHVPWETLAQVVDRDGPYDDVAAARLGLGLLQVLEAAHEVGIVHRDVKPSNVFVAPDDALLSAPEVVVKLSDFGIASIEGDTRLTRTGSTVGSPAYIAPEQASGRPAASPVDLWGLGATLYHAVEGLPPFERSTAVATVHAVVHDEARPFARAEALTGPISALLAKEPADRPAPADIRAALQEVAGPQAPPEAEAAPPAVVPVRSGTSEPAASAPDASPGPSVDARSAPLHRRGGVLAAVAVAMVVAIGVGVATLGGGDDATLSATDDPPPTSPSDLAEDEGGSDEPEQDAGEEDPRDEDPSDEDPSDGGPADPDAEDADAPADPDGSDDAFGPAVDLSEPPADWRRVDGSTYDLAIPADWDVEAGQGNLVDHRDPDTGAYLRVDWTGDPEDDPVANWERFEADFADRQPDYERIELRPATFQGSPAAYWEYTYTSGGTELRAINLNVRVDGGRAYALNVQSDAEDWSRTEELFPALAGGFRDDRG